MLNNALNILFIHDFIATFVLAAILVQLIVIDLREFRLPDRLTLPLIGMGLCLSAWREGGWPIQAAIGALVGYGVFWTIGTLYYRLRGVEVAVNSLPDPFPPPAGFRPEN